jgi:hypothetical protein
MKNEMINIIICLLTNSPTKSNNFLLVFRILANEILPQVQDPQLSQSSQNDAYMIQVVDFVSRQIQSIQNIHAHQVINVFQLISFDVEDF